MKMLSSLQPLALLLLRAALGIIFITHGYPKLVHGAGMQSFFIERAALGVRNVCSDLESAQQPRDTGRSRIRVSTDVGDGLLGSGNRRGRAYFHRSPALWRWGRKVARTAKS